MTAYLTSDFISVSAKQSCELWSAKVTRKLQAGMTSSLTMWRRIRMGLSLFFEVATDGILQVLLKLVNSLRLCVDRMAQGPRLVAAFERFLHREDNFALRHGHSK